jgi:hypothetical protein
MFSDVKRELHIYIKQEKNISSLYSLFDSVTEMQQKRTAAGIRSRVMQVGANNPISSCMYS